MINKNSFQYILENNKNKWGHSFLKSYGSVEILINKENSKEL